MAKIIWSSPAFLAIEKLPQAVAFGIVRLTDYLIQFPRMGRAMDDIGLPGYRQLIYRGNFRITYQYYEAEDCVSIRSVQNCRQQLPRPRDLKFVPPDEELPLE